MNSAVLFLLCTYALVEVHSTTAPYITFMGETLRNNSYVDLSLVGNDASGSDSIQCHSDLSSDGGAWFSPDGESITTTITEDIYQVRQDNRIDLRHRRNGKVSGMYRCEIDTVAAPSIGNSRTDITNTEFVYVGLYTSGGDLSIVGDITMTVDSDPSGYLPQFTLTCVSRGGPATSVTWVRGGALAGGIQETVLDDPVTAQYTHTLTVRGRLRGLYQCIVSNDKSRAVAYYQAGLPLSVTSSSTTSMTVSWALPEELTVTSYTISYYNTNNTQCFNDSNNITGIAASETTYTLTDLQEDTEYSITVTALLSDGHSAEEALLGSTMPTTVPSTAPTAPISMSVSAVTSSSITVQWETVDCIQQIEKITGYSVSCEREGSETVQTMIVSGDSATEATISGLNSSTLYTIKVAAINSVGVGEYSSKSAETDYDNSRTAVKTDPLSVTLDSTSVTSMTVSWALAEELTATSYTISYYNINNTQCFTDSNDITDIAASETTYTLPDLQEDTEYSITVTALLKDGETERDTLVAATMASAPSAPPKMVGVTKVTSSSITVQWEAVDCIHHNGDITGYSVRYGVQGSENMQMMSVSSDDTQTTIPKLLPNTIYEIHVAAVNSVGEGMDSKSIEVSSHNVPSEAALSTTTSDSCTESMVITGVLGLIIGVFVTLLASIILFIVFRRRSSTTFINKDIEANVESDKCYSGKEDMMVSDNAAYSTISTARNSYQEEDIYEHIM